MLCQAAITPSPTPVTSYSVSITGTGAAQTFTSTDGSPVRFNAAAGLTVTGTVTATDAAGGVSEVSDTATFLVPADVVPARLGPLTFSALSNVDDPAVPTIT